MKKNISGVVLLCFLFLSASVFAATENELRRMLTDARSASKFGDFKNALSFCDQIIKAKPDLSEAYAIRSQAKAGLQDMAGAKADAQKAIELAPEEKSTHPAYFVLAVNAFENEVDLPKSLEWVTKAIELTSIEPVVLYYRLRAEIHKDLGKQDLADADLAKAGELVAGSGAK